LYILEYIIESVSRDILLPRVDNLAYNAGTLIDPATPASHDTLGMVTKQGVV
jgi:hypothetical protein